MKRAHECLLAVAAAALLGISPATAHDGHHGAYGDGAFASVLYHYEEVRAALVDDHTGGVADNAQAIHEVIAGLEAGFAAAAAGVRPDKVEEVRALLPLLAEASVALASAEDLLAAREAFYELSKPLVRWRSMATGELPVVAYCSMVRRSWLQPDGALGNPYFGRSMETCGEVVS